MNDIDSLLSIVKRKHTDQWNQLLVIRRLINTNNVDKVFTNSHDVGFLANYLKYAKEKVVFNTNSPNEYTLVDNNQKGVFCLADLEKVNLGVNYDLMHFDLSHDFDDWEMFIHRMIANQSKSIVLSNTMLSYDKSIIVSRTIINRGYELDRIFNDYNGTLIFKIR